MKNNVKPVRLLTDRLSIRPHQSSDEQLLNKAVVDSFKELHVWMDWAETCPNLEATKAYVQFSQQCWISESPEELPLLIFDRAEREILGSSGFLSINWDIPKLEIGYWVKSSHTGKGYITETVNVLSRFAFKEWNAKRLEIRCDSENDKSSSVPKRLGYQLEAHFKNNRIQSVTKKISGTLVFARYDTMGMPELNYTTEYLE